MDYEKELDSIKKKLLTIKNFNLDELLPLLEKHKKSDFQYIVTYYGMNGKISIKNNNTIINFFFI